MRYVSGQDRDQTALFPLSLEDLVPADHPCRVIEAFVGMLDLAELGLAHALLGRTGRPPHDPADLLKLYLYGYLNQVRSSRRLERECQRNVELMWLLGRLAPDHKTIANFRRHNGLALQRAGAGLVRFCQQTGVVKGHWVAVDGSKFQAVASGKAVVRAADVEPKLARLEERIAHYLAQLDAADSLESDSPIDRSKCACEPGSQHSRRRYAAAPHRLYLRPAGRCHDLSGRQGADAQTGSTQRSCGDLSGA